MTFNWQRTSPKLKPKTDREKLKQALIDIERLQDKVTELEDIAAEHIGNTLVTHWYFATPAHK